MTPLLIDEVATQVGVPPDIARTKPPVLFAIAETLPEVPRRRPLRFAKRTELETTRLVVLAVLDTWRLVVVAFVDVEFVNTPVDGVVAPIGVFSIVPPEMVRLSATWASVAEPARSVKLIIAVVTAPAVALRNPVSDPSVNELETTRLLVEANEAVRLVVDALGNVDGAVPVAVKNGAVTT